jgi:hypothetical protein
MIKKLVFFVETNFKEPSDSDFEVPRKIWSLVISPKILQKLWVKPRDPIAFSNLNSPTKLVSGNRGRKLPYKLGNSPHPLQ